MAYVNRGKDSVLDSHYSKKISNFRISLVAGIVGYATVVFIVG